MAYKTILLCLNEVSRAKELVAAGRELGSKFKAHVSGLYVIPAPEIYPAGPFYELPNISDAIQKHYESKLTSVRDAFEEAMKDDGLAYDFRVIEGQTSSIATTLINNTRDGDLIVMSELDPKMPWATEGDTVVQIVMGAGRPVLMLPYEAKFQLTWDEAVIGWNNSREAARAVFDAVPYLQKFKQVRIISALEDARGGVPAATIAAALHRHGIQCEVSVVGTAGMNVGEILQRAGDDFGAGVIVIGAYGHSRLREFVFGGATREMLRDIKRPLLMSH